MKRSRHKKIEPILAEVLKKVAPKIGARVVFEPEWGVVGTIIYKSGRRRYLRYSTLDINRMGASEISRDKNYSKYFLRMMGYPVVKGDVFYSKEWAKAIGSDKGIDRAYKYAKKIGFPVIVKPNSKSRGKGVIKVANRLEFYMAMRRAFRYDNVVMVEEAVEDFRDYRIVVLDDRVISAYERIPLSVIGDGRSTLRMLLKKKQKYFQAIGRDTILNLDDQRLLLKMKHSNINFDSVFRKDEEVFLLDNANLSTGGESRDITHKIHPGFRKLAIELTKNMGLRLCGVDILTIKGASLSDSPKKFYVLEINSAPGLDHYATIGKKQKTIVEKLYLQVIKAMER